MVAKKAAKKAAQRPRWPKGHPLAGKFAPRDLFAEYQKELKARARQEKRAAKLAHDREVRRNARARRAALMVRPGGNTTRSEIQANISGWGSTSTSRLREGTTYAWHGMYRIRGGAEALRKVAAKVGSSRKLPKKKGDEDYELELTPWFGNFTPSEAEAAVPDLAAAYLKELRDAGVSAEYLGAFYNPHGGEA